MGTKSCMLSAVFKILCRVEVLIQFLVTCIMEEEA